MLALGNDIVNLSAERVLNKHLEQRFVQRIFHSKERELILSSNDPGKTLWAIWAAKEACFKACQKKQSDLIFSHKKFTIDFPINDLDIHNQGACGIGSYENRYLSIKWYFNGNIIHAIAVLLNNNQLFNLWDQIKSNIFVIDSTNYVSESLSTKLQAKKFLLSHQIRSYFSIDLLHLVHIEIIRQQSIIEGKCKLHPPKVFSIDQEGLHKLLNIEISLSHDHGWGAVAVAKSDLMTFPF